MNILEFENTQGIYLQYSTANLIERGVAFILDLIIIIASAGLLTSMADAFDMPSTAIQYLISVPVFFFYTLAFEILNDGRSPGKMIMGLKVIRIDGRPVSGYDYLMRWIFRGLDIYAFFGTLACVMIASTPRSQRVGDMLADTTVIRTRNMRVSLSRLLNLSKLSDYKPVYPQAVELKEEQVLLIRETINRFREYKNSRHKEVLNDTSRRVASMLKVEKPGSPYQFLSTVIKDYIAQTR